MRAVLFAAIALLAGCSHPVQQEGALSAFAQSRSMCDVVTNPGDYLGKYVTIRGVYFSDPHHRYIVDEGCRDVEIGVRLTASKDDTRSERIENSIFSKRRHGEISVVYYGTLKGEEMVVGCGKPSCLTYTLEDARLLAWK